MQKWGGFGNRGDETRRADCDINRKGGRDGMHFSRRAKGLGKKKKMGSIGTFEHIYIF